MKVAALGAAEDMRGFRLAGVDGSPAATAEEIAGRVERLVTSGEPPGIVVLSPGSAALSTALLRALLARAAPPLVVVLPRPARREEPT